VWLRQGLSQNVADETRPLEKINRSFYCNGAMEKGKQSVRHPFGEAL